MRRQNILLVSLLVLLYGCQPEVPAQQAAAPAEGSLQSSGAPAGVPLAGVAAVQSSAVQSPVLAEQIAQPAVSEAAAVVPIQPALVEKASQLAAAERPSQSTPVQVVDAPPAKVEPVPAVEIKPEVPPEPAVSEADVMQLAKKNNCFSCHAIGKKVVGPAFRDVAVKYRDDAEAEMRLVAKIAKGGSGVWGVMVMPPSPKVSEADRKILAKWVLSLK